MSTTASDADTTIAQHVGAVWADDVLPMLHDYIRIPCVSQAYDPDWKAHGHQDRATEMIRQWCAARSIAGLTVEVLELPGRSPLIVAEVPAFNGGPADDTVLLYGHCDKQPEMTGWRADLGPWKPVLEDDKLYGRGGADDGYAAFASMLAIEAAQLAGVAHARLIVLIEASEESGSPDLPPYLELLADRIGSPTLVLCLDSGCLDHERMWVTTSLRGLVGGDLRVDILEEGVHSGEASGVVPSSFRIARILLDRLEDSATGKIRLPELHVEIPDDRRHQADDTSAEFPIGGHFPLVDGAQPMVLEPAEQLLARTWRPTLSITGVDGIPPIEIAGNVLRPHTALHLSFRLPPTCDGDAALAAIERCLTTDPPYGAKVQFLHGHTGPGWNAPTFAPWLQTALDDASTVAFGRPTRAFGEGGSIPFMGMLGEMFPDAQFVITGVLGPGSNAHGPNEFLHVPTARKLTECLAHLLRAHAAR
ncbi:MAG: M20/M25/M40 family metallo-hydrolase [Actinomycetota bacterium]|nr:M20/M25/M40 family metallo-hydrolase [Actinomycetota bacterium]